MKPLSKLNNSDNLVAFKINAANSHLDVQTSKSDRCYFWNLCSLYTALCS